MPLPGGGHCANEQTTPSALPLWGFSVKDCNQRLFQKDEMQSTCLKDVHGFFACPLNTAVHAEWTTVQTRRLKCPPLHRNDKLTSTAVLIAYS